MKHQIFTKEQLYDVHTVTVAVSQTKYINMSDMYMSLISI